MLIENELVVDTDKFQAMLRHEERTATAFAFLKSLADKLATGEIVLSKFDLNKGFNELPPENGCRRYELSGEETLTVIYRKPKFEK